MYEISTETSRPNAYNTYSFRMGTRRMVHATSILVISQSESARHTCAKVRAPQTETLSVQKPAHRFVVWVSWVSVSEGKTFNLPCTGCTRTTRALPLKVVSFHTMKHVWIVFVGWMLVSVTAPSAPVQFDAHGQSFAHNVHWRHRVNRLICTSTNPSSKTQPTSSRSEISRSWRTGSLSQS